MGSFVTLFYVEIFQTSPQKALYLVEQLSAPGSARNCHLNLSLTPSNTFPTQFATIYYSSHAFLTPSRPLVLSHSFSASRTYSLSHGPSHFQTLSWSLGFSHSLLVSRTSSLSLSLQHFLAPSWPLVLPYSLLAPRTSSLFCPLALPHSLLATHTYFLGLIAPSETFQFSL